MISRNFSFGVGALAALAFLGACVLSLPYLPVSDWLSAPRLANEEAQLAPELGDIPPLTEGETGDEKNPSVPPALTARSSAFWTSLAIRRSNQPQPLRGEGENEPDSAAQGASPPSEQIASLETPTPVESAFAATGASAAPFPANAPLPPSRPSDLTDAVIPLPPMRSELIIASLPPENALAAIAPAAPPSASGGASDPQANPSLTPGAGSGQGASGTSPAEVASQMKSGDPIYIRIFKKEGLLELWYKRNDRYALAKTYPICKWSGLLGPKIREADYQSPEGFYSVSSKQLHPRSQYHRAFNVGFPNAYDRQNGRTGGLIMVHGACKSVGCFAMTDKGIEQIYGLVAAALGAGQREVPVHIFPFRMTDAALVRETASNGFFSFVAGPENKWAGFWRNLKEGYDAFEKTGEPPVAYACGDRYAFGATGASCKRIAGW